MKLSLVRCFLPSVTTVALALAGCGSSSHSNPDFSHGGGLDGFTVTQDLSSTDLAVASNQDASASSDGGVTLDQGAPTGCTEIMLSAWSYNTNSGSGVSEYDATMTPDTGDTTDPDAPNIQFYSSDYDPSNDGESTGMFDLSKTGDNNYATCSRCVVVYADPDVPGKVFFQQSGTLSVAQGSDTIGGNLSATLTDVTLVEVSIDDSFNSTPVAGGACLHITSAQINVGSSSNADGGTTTGGVPTAWTCDPDFYAADDGCDCGCGAVDPDCADATVGSCDFCDSTAEGGCGNDPDDNCPANVNPTNNAVCI